MLILGEELLGGSRGANCFAPALLVDDRLSRAELPFTAIVCINNSCGKDLLILKKLEDVAGEEIGDLTHLDESERLLVDLHCHAATLDDLDKAGRDQVTLV